MNNAGIFNTSGLEDTSEELWDAIVNINQKGVWLGMKEVDRRDEATRWRLDREHLIGRGADRFAVARPRITGPKARCDC